MRILLTFVVLVLAVGAALAAPLPVESTADGWSLVTTDETSVRFRWRRVDPWPEFLEEARQRGWEMSSYSSCASGLDNEPQPSTHLLVEIDGHPEPLRIDYIYPAEVRPLGVYRHRDTVVATFTALYSCSAGRYEHVWEFASAVRLTPDPALLEHRVKASSGPCDEGEAAFSVDLGFSHEDDTLLIGGRTVAYRCFGSGTSPGTVRWPVGKPPACTSGGSVFGPAAMPSVPRGFLELARVETAALQGRVVVAPWSYPTSHWLLLDRGRDEPSAALLLPRPSRGGSAIGVVTAEMPAPPSVPPQTWYGTTGDSDAVLPEEIWPPLLAPCAVDVAAEVAARYRLSRWETLLSGTESEIGTLTLPCRRDRGDLMVDDEEQWLVRLRLLDDTVDGEAIRTATCSWGHGSGIAGDAWSAGVSVDQERGTVTVTLEPPLPPSALEPDWLSGAHDRPHVFSALAKGDVGTLEVPLTGPIRAAPAASHWTSVTSPTPLRSLSAVATDGQLFVAAGGWCTVATSRDGLAWETRQLGPEGALLHVVHGPAGWLATGTCGTFHSPDGTTWETARGPCEAMDCTPWSTTLLASGDGFLAAGCGQLARSSGRDRWQLLSSDIIVTTVVDGSIYGLRGYNDAQILASADGRTWQARGEVATAGRLLAIGGGWALIQECTISTSDDLVTWRHARLGDCQAVADVTRLGPELVAIGWTPMDEGRLWRSLDGDSWSTEYIPPSDRMRDIVVGTRAAVVVVQNGILTRRIGGSESGRGP